MRDVSLHFFWSTKRRQVTMSVYVTIALHQGVVEDARVFRRKLSANKAEREWLTGYGIADDEDREGKSQNGTEFIVVKCELEP